MKEWALETIGSMPNDDHGIRVARMFRPNAGGPLVIEDDQGLLQVLSFEKMVDASGGAPLIALQKS